MFERAGEGPVLEHVWLDHGEWRREELGDTFLEGRPQLAGTPDGRVWMLARRGATIEAIDVTPAVTSGRRATSPRSRVGWEVNYDSQALARFGRRGDADSGRRAALMSSVADLGDG